MTNEKGKYGDYAYQEKLNRIAGSTGRNSTWFVLWISASKGLNTKVGATRQLVDCIRAFGFRGSNSTSGRAVQANLTSKIFTHQSGMRFFLRMEPHFDWNLEPNDRSPWIGLESRTRWRRDPNLSITHRFSTMDSFLSADWYCHSSDDNVRIPGKSSSRTSRYIESNVSSDTASDLNMPLYVTVPNVLTILIYPLNGMTGIWLLMGMSKKRFRAIVLNRLETKSSPLHG